jgi:predicted nucleotidyltransferase component of viral defense system
MSPVRRDSTAGRAYLDLQGIARRTGRPTQELLVNYVLERFLYRLSLSPFNDQFILKGGMLLAVLGSRRPTADIDLLARSAPNDIDAIGDLVRKVLAIAVDDGVTYEADRLETRVIRDTEIYSGVRLSVPARIGRARAVLRLDVNVGDPVTPHPVDIEYPGLLEESFRLLGYPLATVLAEKVVTMIQRGVTTTRERDFADVLLLSGRHPIDALELLAALRATADHRQAILRPLAGLLEGLGDDRQRSWTTFTTSVGLVGLMPTDYSEVIAAVAAYVDPLLGGSITTGRWDPETRRWAEEERP